MNSLAFWKSWSKPHQLLFWLFAITLLFFICYFWFSYYQYPAPTIVWDQYQQLNTVETNIRSFTKGIFQVPVVADNFLVFEILSGSEPQPVAFPYYIFLISISFTLISLLAIVTSLSRYWYIIGMGIFCLLLMLMPLDSLQIFGLQNKIPIILIIISFAVLSYFFHAIQTHHSFAKRFFAFTILLGFTLFLVFKFSNTPAALLHFSASGYTLALLLTIVFILMVAHEIPVVFINVITQGSRQSKSLQHFLLISAFYLVNLLLAYGIKIGYLSINLWTVNLYFLFTLSAILSLWGFRQREPQYESFFKADPVGVYFILSLAVIAFGTFSYFMSTANDTILLVLRDLIIYSHLGYGIIFLFYVIANFGSMLNQNLQVHKVLYKPNTMPYFTFRLMGLICTFGFLIFDTNWRTPINQSFASYYNSFGDLHLLQGDTEGAEAYYNKSVLFRNQNHHAHYSLAAINAARLEPRIELSELIAAAESNPPEQTLVNLIDAYRRSEKTAEAIQTIEQTKEWKSNKSALLNAKGLIYLKLNMSDSSLIAFQQARNESYMKDIAETNLLAASAHFGLNYPADSLLLLLKSEKEGPATNALALANIQQQNIVIDFKPNEDTTLSATRAAFISNYILNQRSKVDTSILVKSIDLARRPSNEAFKEHLLISVAQAYYTQGRVKLAFELAREVAYSSGKGKYFSLLGTWALEQDNPVVAADYFAIAKDKIQPLAAFNEAIAITETKDIAEAKERWNELLLNSDSLNRTSIIKIIRVLDINQPQVFSLDDESKYLYCRYRLNINDSTYFKSIVNSIASQELKIRTLLDYAEKWYALDEAGVASNYLNMADGLTPDNQATLAKFYYLHGMLLSDAKKWNELIELMKGNELLETLYVNQLIYWRALLNQNEGNPEQAFQLFEYLGNANMYFDEAVVASAHYFMENSKDPLKAYSILVNGLMARPNSVKMLKAYIKQAALIGFDDEAAESLEKLKGLISTAAFNRYLKENPDFFTLE